VVAEQNSTLVVCGSRHQSGLRQPPSDLRQVPSLSTHSWCSALHCAAKRHQLTLPQDSLKSLDQIVEFYRWPTGRAMLRSVSIHSTNTYVARRAGLANEQHPSSEPSAILLPSVWVDCQLRLLTGCCVTAANQLPTPLRYLTCGVRFPFMVYGVVKRIFSVQRFLGVSRRCRAHLAA
jgi:hypothetical protein